MSDTTTIQITTEQKRALDNLKASKSESHKDTLQRLIDSHNQEAEVTESRAREIARDEINRMVTHKALE